MPASEWWKEYSACGRGRLVEQQSPVNVDTTALVDPRLTPLSHEYPDPAAHPEPWTATNNGHSLSLSPPALAVFSLTGGPLGKDTYVLANIHMHWGATDSVGSEHSVHGVVAPLETHLVHFNTKYGNLSVAIEQPDGLAVIGVFSTLGTAENPIPIASIVPTVPETYTSKPVQSMVNPVRLVPEVSIFIFYFLFHFYIKILTTHRLTGTTRTMGR